MRENAPPAEAPALPLRQTVLAVRRLCRVLAEAAGHAHAGLGIGAGQRAVLEALAERGPRTVSQLARAQGLSRQRVQALANALLEAGLVEAADNPDHLRSPLLRLGASGQKALEAARRREARQLAGLAGRIPGADLKATLKTLNALETELGRPQARRPARAQPR